MAAAAADYESDNDSLVATKRRRVKQNLIDDEAEDDDDDEDDEFKGKNIPDVLCSRYLFHSHGMTTKHFDVIFFTEIRKLKAQLAAPLDFDDAGNDVNADTASEVSVKKVSFSSFCLFLALYLCIIIEHCPQCGKVPLCSVCGVLCFNLKIIG